MEMQKTKQKQIRVHLAKNVYYEWINDKWWQVI